MRRGLDEVSGRRKIESRARGAALERAAEIERGFVRRGVDSAAVEAQPSAHSATPFAPAHSARLASDCRSRAPSRARIRSPPALARPDAAIGADPRDTRRSSNSRPWRHGPPSRIQSTLPSRSAATWAAVGRADGAGSVGGGGREGDAGRVNERPGRCVRRRANPNRVKAGAREQADVASRGHGQDQSERPGPECAGQRLGLGAKDGVLSRRLDVENMGDERVDRGPLLGGVDRRDRLVRGRVRREAVDRLGRHGDEAAQAKTCGRGGDRLGARFGKAGHSAVERHVSFRSALRANATVHKLFCPCRSNQGAWASLGPCLAAKPIGPARSRQGGAKRCLIVRRSPISSFR